MRALGMIEVYGYLTAVEALDSALKAANVGLVEVKKVTGGLVSVMVTGDVGATRAAIDAAATAAARVGEVVSVHVIPRPAADIARMLGGGGQEPPGPVPPDDPIEPPAAPPPDDGPAPEEAPAVREPGEDPPGDLEKMTVQQLRAAARELELPGMTKRDIRYAKKDELIQAMREHADQER